MSTAPLAAPRSGARRCGNVARQSEGTLTSREEKRPSFAWYLLLVIPFVATLWVPFYDSLEPRLGGFPFFYWYQFLWVGIGAVLTGIVYFATRRAP